VIQACHQREEHGGGRLGKENKKKEKNKGFFGGGRGRTNLSGGRRGEGLKGVLTVKTTTKNKGWPLGGERVAEETKSQEEEGGESMGLTKS